MLRTLLNRAVLAVATIALTATMASAGDELTVLVHGLGSKGETWETTAARLQQELAMTTYRPTLDWQDPFHKQAGQLQTNLSARPGTPVVVGHSNGGLVSRQLSKTFPVQAIVTLGTPNGGAPFARNLVRWSYWVGSVYGIIGNIVSTFGTAVPPVQVVVGISIADRYGEDSIVRLLATLGIDKIVPVFVDMSPGSAFIGELNSAANLAREASQVPTRVGIVSFDPRYKVGGPFRIANPENADEIGLAMVVAGYVLDAAATGIWANANSSDPEDLTRALNQMYAIWDLVGWLLDFDEEWCQAISNPNYPYGNRCDASDGIVPYWAQLLPNAPNIRFPGGPIHTQEIVGTHDQLYEALTVYARVQPRPGGGDFVPPVVRITDPAAASVVSGTVSVSADADDDIGVSRVDFSSDGALIGSVAGRPYEVSWDTTVTRDGSHTIIARAYDAAGNRATASEEVIVTNGKSEFPPPVDTLPPGTSLTALTSPDGRFHLVLQGDGNLVLYGGDWASIWASGTAGSGAGSAFMQLDGNFVIYDIDSSPVFATNTEGHPGAVLALQNDGDVVVRSNGGVALWSTGTGR
jgi:pimeloyl-ACP methyl ester carboxylesterase